jgi:DNA-binding winged helix-turn-helix (wHTH) protein
MRLQFGNCSLDFDTREVTRKGKPIHLEPKAYRLLELLLASRPKALSKAELQDFLWPKTFVSERSLARLVEVVRSALGDSARKSRYIRTVHGFGYAFSGEATESRPATGRHKTELHCRIAWVDREVALVEGENILGRDPDAVVWIDLNSVSRRHARILVTRDTATIEDLQSRNGTYVGGLRIAAPKPLANGDRIKIGAASLVFRSFRGLESTKSEAAP